MDIHTRLQQVPGAEWVGITRAGVYIVHYDNGTSVAMSPDEFEKVLSGTPVREFTLPATDFFYKRALDRSAEIKRGENLE